jgi:hypothetical protein
MSSDKRSHDDVDVKSDTRAGSGSASAKAEVTKPSREPEAAVTISVWEDDPESAVIVARPVPDLKKTPLAYNFPAHAPKPAPYKPGTQNFRYWVAAEALRRGADFWASRISGINWQMGESINVILDGGEDLNAYYDRQALNFFHGPGPNGVIFSGESPDVLCHEMGHAILDAIKPELWDVASHEAAAFHESFGDISAILSALQLSSLRVAILSDTGGHLYRNSRLSRLAEQLGSAIRAQFPDKVERDCLRNAVNSFSYQDPIRLPSLAPASQLSSEPHSFSRVFTGGFLQALAGLLTISAADSNAPTEQELLDAANAMADILVAAVRDAPVVSNFYSQIAAGMVQVSSGIDRKYSAVLKAVFTQRAILSMQSATTMEAFEPAVKAIRAAAPAARATGPAPSMRLALSAVQYGLGDRPLLVEAPAQIRRFAVSAAAHDFGALEPASSATAAQAFVEELFRRGKIDHGKIDILDTGFDRGLKTHQLVEAEEGIALERRLFDCGCGSKHY